MTRALMDDELFIVCPVCRLEGCEDPTHQPPSPPVAARTASRLTVLKACEAMTASRPIEIVEGVAWADSLTLFASESGTGKTFVTLDLNAAVSDGVPWHGRATQQGSVVYLAYEGDALGLRLRALRDSVGRRLEHFYVIRAHDPLSPRAGRDGEDRAAGEVQLASTLDSLVAELATTQRPPIRLLTVDTVRASMTGSEDSSEHVAAYLRSLRRIMTRAPGAGTILVHHAGWQDGEAQRKRERGSSAWRGNVDCTLYLEAGDYDPSNGQTELILRTLKVRDAERPAPLHLIRRRIELLERDRHGDPVTSCVIDRDRRSRADREAEQVAAAESAHRDADLAVLKAMRDYPTATSISRLRPYLGLRTGAVSDAVARLLSAGWVIEGRRGQPFTLTDAGRARLNGDVPL